MRITIDTNTAEVNGMMICVDIADPDQPECDEPEEITQARNLLAKLWNALHPVVPISDRAITD